MQTHVESCPVCRAELVEFRGMSTLARQTALGEAPAEIWHHIAASLDGENAVAAPHRPVMLGWFAANRYRAAGLGIAAAAALVLAAIWLGGTGGRHDNTDVASAAFDQYLTEFRRDPSAAQQWLLTKYAGQSVDPQTAVNTVGYRPVVAKGLPPGYAMDSVHVMTMPCCKCVQCVCRREDGSTLVIFEHGGGNADPLGDENMQACEDCADGRCMMLRSADAMASSWHHAGRHITVVGARDAEEVGRLSAWFAESRGT